MGDKTLNGKRYVERSRDRGQSLVEYAMIGALVVLVAIGALNFLGQGIQEQFSVMAADMNSSNSGIALSAPPGGTPTATDPTTNTTDQSTATDPTTNTTDQSTATDPATNTTDQSTATDPATNTTDPATTEPVPVATSTDSCQFGALVNGICQASVDGW
jgi:Flp pilus assembly pilin Flp